MDAVAPTSEHEFVPVYEVSGWTMADLRRCDRPEMKKSLQQAIRSLDDANGVISAFQSFAPDR